MRLACITVRDFRKLAGEWRIGPLAPGLTVIGGDNEEGKSTLLEAVKAGLFEHWKISGQQRQSLNPRGGGSPRIELVFELGGVDYELKKEFGRDCTLACSRGRWRGDEAEAELQRLLRFERRHGRGERRPQHQGLLALFWVDQGTSFLPDQLTSAIEAHRDRLRAALEREIETVVGGTRLAALRARIDKNYERFYTPKGQERAGKDDELAKLRRDVAALEAETERLRRVRTTYDEKIDALQRALEKLARARDRDVLVRAQARLDRAREARDRIERLEEQRERTRILVQKERSETERLEQAANQRAERRRRLARDEEELRKVERQREELEARIERAQQRCSNLDQDQIRLAEAAACALDRSERARAARELLEREERATRLRTALEEAECTAATLARRESERAAIRIDARNLALLRAAFDERERREAVLRAQATRIELFPEPGRSARTADGAPLDASRPLDLTAPTELILDGFGRIRISPGGDLAELERRREEASERFRALLDSLGFPDLQAAEAALQRRHDLDRELAGLQAKFDNLLKSIGAADCAAARKRLQAELDELERSRAALGAEAEVRNLERDVEAAAAEARAYQVRLNEVRAEATKAGEELAALREEDARLRGRHEQLLNSVTALREAVLADEAEISEADLEAERRRAEERLANARALLGAIETELESLDPARVRAEERAAQDEIAKLKSEEAEAQREVDQLQGEVRGLGVEACDARLEELERRLDELRAQLAASEREARAWKLLRETLSEQERKLTSDLVEPLRQRFLPYLRKLFPDAEPLVDRQRLVPIGLQRGDAAERLEELSVGTREQLAILVRLALADLLREREGEAPCLLLDDALVFSDERRFARMKTILAGAAEQQQIVILTCRPRDWADLQAHRILLESCRVGA
ncbi:MAG: AAA family ATPase [Geminicoccaceae bacterium]|nr:AAA family ATPase [Geminicoccaceae bacterium]